MQNVNVPAVGWWVLLAMLIPPIQTWIETAYPNQQFPWSLLVVGVLGALLKWVQYMLEKNKATTQAEQPGAGAMAAPMPEAPKHGLSWWIVG